MNFIDHSADEIRQIIPQDFSFLSDADFAVTAALQALLDQAAGVTGGTYIISGCQFTPDVNDTDYGTYCWGPQDLNSNNRSNKATLANHYGLNPGTYTYHIADGILLHGGKLYTLTGGDFDHQRIVDIYWNIPRTHDETYQKGYIAFGSQVVSPSPVYGESLQLDQSPHKALVAAIAQGTETKHVVSNSHSGESPLDPISFDPPTTTYETVITGNPTDYVAIADLLVIPQLATFSKLQ